MILNKHLLEHFTTNSRKYHQYLTNEIVIKSTPPQYLKTVAIARISAYNITLNWQMKQTLQTEQALLLQEFCGSGKNWEHVNEDYPHNLSRNTMLLWKMWFLFYAPYSMKMSSSERNGSFSKTHQEKSKSLFCLPVLISWEFLRHRTFCHSEVIFK